MLVEITLTLAQKKHGIAMELKLTFVPAVFATSVGEPNQFTVYPIFWHNIAPIKYNSYITSTILVAPASSAME